MGAEVNINRRLHQLHAIESQLPETATVKIKTLRMKAHQKVMNLLCALPFDRRCYCFV